MTSRVLLVYFFNQTIPKTNKKPANLAGLFVFDLAAELGLEPRQYESES